MEDLLRLCVNIGFVESFQFSVEQASGQKYFLFIFAIVTNGYRIFGDGVPTFNSTIREGFDIMVEGTGKERDREIKSCI